MATAVDPSLTASMAYSTWNKLWEMIAEIKLNAWGRCEWVKKRGKCWLGWIKGCHVLRVGTFAGV